MRETVEWCIGRGKPKNSGENSVPVPLCPPQIPPGLTLARTWASAVRGRQETTWAMARPNLSHYPDICVEELRKSTKSLNQDCRSLGQDLNPGLPEYEAGVFTTRSRRLAWIINCEVSGRKGSWPNFNKLSRNLPGGTEEGPPAFWPRFEPGTSQKRSRSFNHSQRR
jgi:hypothetical protein